MKNTKGTTMTKKRPTKPAKNAPKQEAKLEVFILLDRSGSMGSKWTETLSSLNTYVNDLAKNKVKGRVTLAAFDEHVTPQFDIVRNNDKFEDYKDITSKEISPRGGTPLYDSLLKIVDLANKAGDEKTVIVVVTDGDENASKEVNREKALDCVEQCKKKGWEVIFLGADFDAAHVSASVGLSSNKFVNVTVGNYESTMRSMSAKTMCYASGMSASIDITAEDKAAATKA